MKALIQAAVERARTVLLATNNIVLIDTYNVLRRQGLEPMDAALRTGAQRLRPVLLTSVTTILGLVPMVLAVTIDFIGRDFSIGAPSTQYWVQLATAISGGLLVATPLTLLVTPALLVWGETWRWPGRALPPASPLVRREKPS